jgi:hypothetical protein
MRRGEGQGLTIIYWSSAVLNNGLSRYEKALAAAQQAGEEVSASGIRNWALVELIEAAARTGNVDLAADALGRLSQKPRLLAATGRSEWRLVHGRC